MMAARDSARAALRSATASHHDRVDHLFSRLNLGDAEGYRDFLIAQAAAHLPVERALTLAGADEVLPDWPARQRSDALRADLAALGAEEPRSEGTMHFAGPEAVLGGIYVLEGSRLGGRMLRRQVPSHLPATFLGAGDSAAWQRLLAALERKLVTEEQRSAAVAAAIHVFGVFERAAARLG